MRSMDLVKTTLLTVWPTLIKILSALAINKAVAILIGPSGLALLAQFQNFVQLSLIGGQGGISSGVTKYTAEYGADTKRLSGLFGASLRITIACSVCCALAMSVFANELAAYLLKEEGYTYVVRLFASVLVLFSLNNLLLSIINGLKEIKLWVHINILQSLITLILNVGLIYLYKLEGALIALATNQAIVFLVLVWKIRAYPLLNFSLFLKNTNTTEAKKLFGFALMAITTAIVTPVSQLLVRSYIGDSLSWQEAGYWQSIWYVSSVYLMVMTTPLAIYYLPTLSELGPGAALRKELVHGYCVILPTVIISSAIIYFSRDLIIEILFSTEFESIRNLFFWQLVGDVIKIASWLLSYIVLAKAMIKTHVCVEIIFGFLFVFLSFFMIDRFGVIGVSYAYIINYLCLFLVMGVVTRRFWSAPRKQKNLE